MTRKDSNFVLGNAQVPSLYPIVYCSDGFCELTGFQRAQIMQRGCACAFLYGPDTSEEHKEAIETALLGKTELKLEVNFYRKNGQPFWCLLDIVPIKNEKNKVVLFLASHKDITKSKLAEQHDNLSGGKSGVGSSGSGEEQDEEDEEESETKRETHSLYQRRRSRAVLYQLSGHYRKSDSTKGKIRKNLMPPNSIMPEYAPQSNEKPWHILDHYGIFKTAWDWLILLGTCYVAAVVPFSVTFRDNELQEIFIYSDVAIEIIFIIDILVNFQTTYVNKNGEVKRQPMPIIQHYLKTWFICDLLAALPFDVLYALNLYSRSTFIHMLKLTRLIRLVRLYSKMDRYSHNSFIILLLLILAFAACAHWFACIWYTIAWLELTSHPDWQYGWLKQLSYRLGYDVHNASETSTAYITALYFTTSSLTSVGFGNVSANTNWEKFFSVIVMILGALMHAVVFGNVTAIIQRMYARKSQYQTRLRDLKDFFRLHQLPKGLKQRMNDFFQTTWSLNHGIDAHEILKEFPEELRGDVSLHMHREMLSLPIFVTAPTGCLKLLSQHIRSIFSAPEEYLVHNGDALNYIYLVCNGSMEVLQEEMVVAILGKGDLVGCNIPHTLDSESLIKSSGDVKALTYCDLKSIQISGLLEVLRLYPEFAETFCEEIKHDLTFNLREGFDADAEDDDIGVFGYGGQVPIMSHNEGDDDEDDDEEFVVDSDDHHDGSPHDEDPGNEGGRGAGSEQINKETDEMDDEFLSDSNQTNKANKIRSDDTAEKKMPADIVAANERNLRNKIAKRCTLDKVGSVSSLNESCLQNRLDRLEHIDPHLKYGQLRLADDDTNEDEEDPDSIASCPPVATQAGKSLLISKLKANTKSPPTKSPLNESGESSPPDTLNKRKYLHFNTTKPQDLPPAFRSRKTIGYNLPIGSQDRPIDRYRTGQYRAGGQIQPRKALRFSQQLNSSGSSANSPIFNSFAERRRAQFTNFTSSCYTKTGGPQPGGRRSSGASIHSMIQESATVAAVQAVHDGTADSLERMDNQLHGLGDEVHRLSSDVKLSLYLLKQMCDLAAVNLSQQSQSQNANGQSSQHTDHSCNCNSKLIEQLKHISSNIEQSAQLNAIVTGSNAKQVGGILKSHKKRSVSSNSSQSLTDMLNEQHRLQLSQQPKPKMTAKLAKCSSHSSLTLPLYSSPPANASTTNKSDLKSKYSSVHFGAAGGLSDTIKEMNELKLADQETNSIAQKVATPEIDETSTLRNVRHSWNSLTQFIDSSTSSNEQAVESSTDFGLKSESVEIDLNAHSETPILAELAGMSATTGRPNAQTTHYNSRSNGTSINLSWAIDIEPTDKKS